MESTEMQEQEESHSEVTKEENDHVSSPLQRLGDVEKCPVCGSHVDAEAYHCPSCRNYFCYHCRARSVSADTQLQCTNQRCVYYGKLVCDVCDVAHERDEAPSVYAEPEDGYWPGWLLLAFIVFGVVWYFKTLLVAVITVVLVFFLGGVLLHIAGLNIFGRERVVEHQRKSAYHSCVSCGEVVKEVQGAS